MKTLLVGAALLLLLAGVEALHTSRYSLRFEHEMGIMCTGPSPKVHIGCTGDITVRETSDVDIVCQEPSRMDGENPAFNHLVCTKSCFNFLGLFEACGSFSETVQFECSGESLVDVDAYASFEDTGDGSCVPFLAFLFGGLEESSNIRRASLGVECDGQYNSSTDYFDCKNAGIMDTSTSLTCYDGMECDFFGCFIDFMRFQVDANPNDFDESCVETTTAAPTKAPTASPTTEIVPVDTDAQSTEEKSSSSLFSRDGEPNVGFIVGLVVAGLALIAGMIVGVALYKRKQRNMPPAKMIVIETKSSKGEDNMTHVTDPEAKEMESVHTEREDDMCRSVMEGSQADLSVDPAPSDEVFS